MSPLNEYRVIGTRPIRADAVDKVTGRAVFGPDIKLPNMMRGWVLRSPYAHARILSIDTRRAEAQPGVHAVVTAWDLAEFVGVADEEKVAQELRYDRDRVLAGDRVLFEGHAVAAVAAATVQEAEEAAKMIRVEYEPLPVLLDVLKAAKEGAPLVHGDLRTRSLGPDDGYPSNVASHIQHVLGDPEGGFAEADEIVEREFRTSMVHQGYLEPHVSTAQWGPDGNLHLWSSTQGSFRLRDQVSSILGIPLSKIVVTPTEVGGAFGGKTMCHLDPVNALLSMKAGRPVKMVMTQADVFRASGPAPGSVIRVKMGATRGGRMTAAKAEVYMEAGAYPGAPIGSAANCLFPAYDIPNGQIDCYDVVLNKPYVSDYRAPGSPQVTFAVEQVVDELAQRLGLDPIEFRLMNVSEEGDRNISGAVHKRIGAKEVLEAVRDSPHYRAPLEGANVGRGVAMGYWGNWGSHSSCTLSVNEDGSVTLITGSVDLSGTRTTLAMQAAEVLGIGLDKVRSIVGDTDSVGFTQPTGGSRTTFATGRAVILAVEHVLVQMSERAALLWDVPAETVSYDGRAFTTSLEPGKRITFEEMAAQLNNTGGPVTGKGNIDAQGWGTGFGCHIADVEVDPETGRVRVLGYTAVQDVGKAIHPTIVEGQMQGGAAQGIGWALWEGYKYDREGRLLNPNRLDYKQPTFMDLPRIATVMVEVPGPNHPFGVRGVGETPIVPPPAAIANAVHSATRHRFTRLPITPERILRETGVM